ncbi:obscurin-like protein 1 isoform X7 [Seriola aureovittata]|uniref:obscurin-like protein 1 isoform X7 n=1 Tax=Seriola aureovittata TaxID=2871759 RepID=UPI0024BDC697|nr:obscurin-like protein 1 isoform X7 [Seriola aureovittata]
MDVFGGAPRFLAYPRPVVVKSGTDAVLKCQIGGDPRPAVIWERNNEKIDPQGRYRVFEDGNVYNLIISAVTTEDSGQYICKAKNSIGETYAAATLKVEGEAQEMELREENKPRFLIKPLSTRAGRGEDAVFSCKLWGNPRPEVVWEKDGRKLNEIFESTHFSVSYQDGGWFQLKIFKTRAPDGGVYTCKARNEFGEALAGAVLLVDAGPGHEEDGNRNGYTNGHWKAYQGKQKSGRQVSNRLKDDTMTKSTKVKMFAVTEGKHAKFRCFVTGKPKPEIIWRKDGRLILSGRRYLLYEDREGYFTLKVLYCKQKDNGVYVCAASNTAGQTLSAVHLSVKEPPVRFKQPLIDLEVWERDLAVLECEVPEDSVPITWYLEDRRLQPGAKYGMEEWGTKRRLTIRDIGVDDDGIYLCEMPDGGRSIAEVAVKGTILRKLPRKVDVLEGENAAFCVEVEKEEMDIHWYKDGIELRETHQTILKSFGRTHILVFVNTMPQDSGLVTFLVGRSKTSSQLRVKAARHCPPSCPVGVQINTERANAALLSWVPAQDSRKNPPSGYVLERQEVGTGSQEWLQCLTTDSATSVEILGDSVPCEADYRFRICSVNKYGKSNNVEFPRAVHLVPVARIQAPLQDALVPEGQDAIFSIELSASVIGTWFLNGTQLQEDERYSMRRSRTHQSLRIRGVRDTDNGAEITFIAYGIRDSAALYIQAPLVKFSSLSEMDRNKFVEIGNPIVLYCELSDPAAPVHWYKNGVELQTMEGLHIQSEGTMRRIVIQSAEFSHSGVYCCDAIDDVIRFNVEVEAPPVRFSAMPDVERNKTIPIGCPIVLQCELSDPSAQVHWYKDGSKLHPQNGVEILTDGLARKLIVHSAEYFHSGLYCCKTKGDTITFSVDIKAPPVKFSAIPEEMRTKSIEAGCPIVLQCVVSDPEAHVCWYKDEMQLISNSAIEIHSDGNTRTLVVQSAELCHSGVYRCTTQDDTMEFQVEIKAPMLPVSPSPDVVETQSLEAACSTDPTCETSDPAVHMSWQRDKEHDSNREPDYEMGGIKKTLVIEPTHPSNSGAYYCATADDVAQLIVKNQVPSPTYLLGPDVEKTKSAEEHCQIVQQFEISDPIAKACWYKDGTQIYPKMEADCESQSSIQALPLQSHDLSGDERFGCETSGDSQSNVDMKAEHCHYGDEIDEIADASAQYTVDVKAPPVTITTLCEAERNKSIEVGEPIVLRCEISDPNVQVTWYKDGIKLHEAAGQDMVAEGSIRTLVFQSAMVSHAGIYSCKTTDDAMQFHVDVKAPPLKFSAIHEADQKKTVMAGCPIALQCELSDATGQVSWYKDGTKLLPQSGVDIQSEGNLRSLVVPSAEEAHTGIYRCESKDDDIQFAVEVKALPVKFSELQETDRNKSVQEGTPIVLSCELCHDASAHVDWYKDGMKLLPQNNVEIQSDGLTRKLLICSSENIHGGTYECSTSDDTVTFKVDVKGRSPQIMPVPLSERNKTIAIGCPIILQCEVSDPVAQVSWFKDGVELFCKTGLDMKRDGSFRKLMIHSAKVSDAGLYSCSLAEDVVTFHVDVEATPVRFSALPEVARNKFVEAGCPIKLQCEVSEPTAQVYWHKDGEHLPPKSEYEIQTKENLRALVIQSAEVTHSGVYSCEAADDHIEFKVDVAAPPVTFADIPEEDLFKSVVEKEQLVLSCEVSRTDGLVQWYKDGTEMQPSNNITMQAEDTKRNLTIHSAQLSNTGTYTCRAGDNILIFKVTIREPPVMIIYPKEDVHLDRHVPDEIILSCELSRPNGVVSWYKDGQKLQESENIKLKIEGPYRRLKILSSGVEDSGEYVCDTADDSIFFHLSITEPPVRIVSPSQSQMELCQQTSERMVLSCEISRPNAVVRWYRDGLEVEENDNLILEVDGVYRRLIIPETTVKDSAEYVCDTADDSMTFFVNIAEPPVRFLRPRKTASRVEKVAGETVVLDCEVSRSNAEVTWKKNGEEVEDSRNITVLEDGVMRQLTIHCLTVEDAGQYVCDAKDDVMDFHVNVQEMKVKFTKPLENTVSLKGSSLTLRCEISKPKGDVQWLKDGQEISPSRRHTIRAQGRERNFTIHQIAEEDAGEYACESTDDRTSATVTVETPRVVEFIAELRNITVREGEDAVFKCVVSPVDTQLAWHLNGKQVALNERTVISSNGLCHMLCIHNCTVSDSGRVTADAEGLVSEAELQVQEQQVMFTKKMTPVSAEEYSEAILEVEVSLDSGEVQWMRQGVLIHPEAKYTLKNKGRKHSLTIHKLAVSDRGTYSCETLHDRTQAQLTVEPRKITIKRGLTDIKTTERETASFEVELSHPNVPGTWMRNGIQLKPTNHFRMSAKGQVHSLTISNLSVEDTGTFTFSVENLKTSARLVVKEPPVTIFRKLEDQKFSEGAVISIECELSRHNVNVKWIKNEVEVKPGKDLRIYGMGRKRFLQIMKCHVSDSGTYTCDAGDAITSCTVEVYERELLILQGLEDLDIQEDQNAVFVCEISVEDVPGEWLRNGERIQPTSTIKIRQEGTKHFLLMCNVRAEDSGEIKFVARHVESVAYLEVEEIPVNIVKPLQDKTALEKTRVILDCTVSNSRCSIRWYKGCNVILPSERFEICSEGCYRKLVIQQVALDDEGTYSVQVGEHTCSAKLTVEAQSLLMVRELKDVEVKAPDEACFECEVSVPVLKAPVWSLNGEPLQPSPQVLLEKMGTVHRLTLRQTSPDMNGVVEFSSGKTKSRAQLQVLSDP